MASGFSLKDQLFNIEKTRYLAGLFAQADSGFDAAGFEKSVMSRLLDLELKERIDWIATCLAEKLPDHLPDAAPLLRAALPPPLDPDLKDDDFGDFIFAPLGAFVVRSGLEHHADLSLDLLEEITQRFSVEWAIRPLLNQWPQKVLSRMEAWATHDSYHVRRLVSEGTRPRLPWGMSVGLALEDPLPLLDQLHSDPTRYVTRSVANHLNDITKKDPDLVLAQLAAWRNGGMQDASELDWMTAHALRGLVKAGHPGAMTLLGYDPEARVEVHLSLSAPNARIGEALNFAARINGAKGQKVMVDYRIHFLRPGGKLSVKTFKLKQAVLGADGLQVEKSHKLKGNATTFTLVPGGHLLDVMVNGRVRDRVAFELRA